MEEFITTKFTALLDDILPRLEQQPGRVIAVVPGIQITWDDCCQGQLTARLVSLTPIMVQGNSVVNCGISYWQAIGEVSLLRCSQALEEDGTAPQPQKILNEGVSALQDTDALVAALGAQDWIKSIGPWVPLGPQADCRGVSLTFNFNLDQPN